MELCACLRQALSCSRPARPAPWTPRCRAARPADPARPAGPGALQRGGADLLQRGPPPARAGAAAADPALSRAAADHARNMARLRTHSHVLPVRGQARPVAADAPPVARVPHGGGEHRHGQGLSAARPADLDRRTRAAASPMATPSEPVPIHTYASLAQEVVGALAGLAEAPGLAALAGLPAARAPASASTRAGRPAATSTWCRTSPTEARRAPAAASADLGPARALR